MSGHPTSCPRCGSTELVPSTRDGPPFPAELGGERPPRTSWGEWVTCRACGWEEPVELPGGEAISDGAARMEE